QAEGERRQKQVSKNIGQDNPVKSENAINDKQVCDGDKVGILLADASGHIKPWPFEGKEIAEQEGQPEYGNGYAKKCKDHKAVIPRGVLAYGGYYAGDDANKR